MDVLIKNQAQQEVNYKNSKEKMQRDLERLKKEKEE